MRGDGRPGKSEIPSALHPKPGSGIFQLKMRRRKIEESKPTKTNITAQKKRPRNDHNSEKQGIGKNRKRAERNNIYDKPNIRQLTDLASQEALEERHDRESSAGGRHGTIGNTTHGMLCAGEHSVYGRVEHTDETMPPAGTAKMTKTARR